MSGRILSAAALVVIVVLLTGLWYFFASYFTFPADPTSLPPPPVLGIQTRDSGCQPSGSLPDPDCTPGAVFSQATAATVCSPGYSQSVRDVSADLKNKVYLAYGILTHSSGEYEIDHLISLELGGSNDFANLWPEAAAPQPGFHQKDLVENYLHRQVCQGLLPLSQAQYQISHDWLVVWDQIR